jgi:quinol monooxygenase YgiN
VSEVSRYGKMVARAGKGPELADLMLAVAEAQEADPGCLLYLLNRQADEPDTLWITELWRSQADLDASIEGLEGNDQVARVRELVADGGMIELELLGGKGPI